MLPNDPQPPANVRLVGSDAFQRYFSQREVCLSLGERSWADGTTFAVGTDAVMAIGSDCYLNDCILLAELEIRIWNYVMIGWRTTISDSDFQGERLRRIDSHRRLRTHFMERPSDGQLPGTAFDCTKTRLR